MQLILLFLLPFLVHLSCGLAPGMPQESTCGECAAGDCKLIKGLDVTATLELKDNGNLQTYWTSGTGAIVITQGTTSDMEDTKRCTISTQINYQSKAGCYVVGITPGAGKEQYAIVDNTHQYSQCAKVFGFAYTAVTKVQMWYVGDKCPS